MGRRLASSPLLASGLSAVALSLSITHTFAQSQIPFPRAQRPTAPQAAAPAPAGPAARVVDPCSPQAKTLGVSRIVEIDTAGGPRFGHQQYKDVTFLEDGEIVLTFDDGPLRMHTQAVVNALDGQCTKATFFMVGSQAVADPDMVKIIAKKGHTVGTHTWSHTDLRKLNQIQARREVELAISAVTLAAGQPISPFFRFPFLSDSTFVKGYAQTRGIGVFSIEIDALDYKNKENPEAVHKVVIDQLAYHKKGILLFHDIQPSTAMALPGLLAALKAKGFRVVHMRAAEPIKTLPEFDVIARKEFNDKRIAAAGSPLGSRAVTFPLPSKQSLPGAVQTPADAATAPTLPPPVTTSGPVRPYGAPYQPPPSASAPQPYSTQPNSAPAVRPPPRRTEDDWRRRLYQN